MTKLTSEQIQQRLSFLIEIGELIEHKMPQLSEDKPDVPIWYEDMGGHAMSETGVEDYITTLEEEGYFKGLD